MDRPRSLIVPTTPHQRSRVVLALAAALAVTLLGACAGSSSAPGGTDASVARTAAGAAPSVAPDAGRPASEATTLGPVSVRLPAGFEVVDVPDASVLDRFGARREDARVTAVLAVVWRRDGALPAAEQARELADRVGAVAEEVDLEGATEAWQVAHERQAPTGHDGQLAASRAVSVAADVDAGVVVVEALAPVAAYDASGLPEALHSLTADSSWRG